VRRKARLSKAGNAIGISPIKLANYASAGRPVIASALRGIRELGNEQWITLYSPDDPASLADAIASLLDDPRLESRGQQARIYAERHYSWARVATALEENISRVQALRC
jgi:glycosyltransferase involved in cell wall biosynthesis